VQPTGSLSVTTLSFGLALSVLSWRSR
jgi:hypothetical protein